MLSYFQVLVAIFPRNLKQGDKSIATQTAVQTRYFDFETKSWKLLPSMASLTLGRSEGSFKFLCAEYVGNYLYVAVKTQLFRSSGVIYRYHVANNTWESLPPFQSSSMGYGRMINCLCYVNEYLYAISNTDLPQRYSLAQNQWQSGSKLPFLKKSNNQDKLCNVAAVVMKSKIYVLHECYREEDQRLTAQTAVSHCFDPEKNEWKQKASTSSPHFGSTLFVDHNKLYVAGGKISCWKDSRTGKITPCEDPAPVEVYDEETNQWFVVDQTHIPPNNLGAVEVEGKVYFIINKFPVDSGIRILPGEVYHISLHEWSAYSGRKIGRSQDEFDELDITAIDTNAMLCFLPVKVDNLKIAIGREKSANKDQLQEKLSFA